jgi:hypothetical protein
MKMTIIIALQTDTFLMKARQNPAIRTRNNPQSMKAFQDTLVWMWNDFQQAKTAH